MSLFSITEPDADAGNDGLDGWHAVAIEQAPPSLTRDESVQANELLERVRLNFDRLQTILRSSAVEHGQPS